LCSEGTTPVENGDQRRFGAVPSSLVEQTPADGTRPALKPMRTHLRLGIERLSTTCSEKEINMVLIEFVLSLVLMIIALLRLLGLLSAS
jgi:hypothetical protein